MAAQLSLWLAKEIIDHINRKETWTPTYSFMYLGLATSATNLRNNLLTNEISTSGTGYARIQIGVGSSNVWTAANASGISYVNGQLDFSQATADWTGTITHAFTIDSSSGAGNVYEIIDVAPNKIVDSGDYAIFVDGEIWVGL